MEYFTQIAFAHFGTGKLGLAVWLPVSSDKPSSLNQLLRIGSFVLLVLFSSLSFSATNFPANQLTLPSSITVVMDDNYPPYAFRDSNGVLNGYLVDMWKLWGEKTGIHVDLKATDWVQAQNILATGHADVIDTIFETPEREVYLDFTAAYANISVPIYSHRSVAGITDLQNLRGFLIGVKQSDACVEKLETAGITTLQQYPNYESLVQAAIGGQIKVFCLDAPPANYLLYRDHADQLFNVAFELYTGQFHRAVRKGSKKTLSLVELGFSKISSEEEQTIKEKWMGHTLKAIYGKYLGYFLIALIVAAMLLAVWTFALRRVVKQRTQQLENERTRLKVLLETIPDLVWLKDVNGIYLSCNRIFERAVAKSKDQIIGKTDFDLWETKQAETFRQNDIDTIKAGSSTVTENKLVFMDHSYTGFFETIKTPLRDVDGKLIGVLGVARDITERKEAEQRAHILANYDILTGLPNRTLFNDRIDHQIRIAQRNNTEMAVMILDLDHFKNVNDTLGHQIGDKLLIEVAKRLKTAIREEDTISRLGGDEFILFLPDTEADGAARVAEKLLNEASFSYKVLDHDLTVTPSIGIAMYPGDGESFDKLYQCADVAMYRAKHGGRNLYRFFTAEMQAVSVRKLSVESTLRVALDKNEFQLHFQPQISVHDGRMIGAEALLRWHSQELGMVSPAEFIPIAENSGQILQIGEWVLRRATQQLSTWMRGGMAPIVIAVNLSAVQFRHPRLPELVTEILHEVNIPAELLELELTEGVALDDPDGAVAIMDNLHHRGIRMSIDDFGTGYSSLSYLKRFRIYKLKIDQSFVRGIHQNPEDQAIVKAIINLADSLGMQTIAEGVETEEELGFLRKHGCKEVQGYLFSKPLTPQEFMAFSLSHGSV